MRSTVLAALGGLALLLTGCAHAITITPSFDGLDRNAVQPIDKAVGFYISPADKEKKVITAGGGGDKVAYYPYRDLEPALQKVLYNQFRSVKRLNSPTDTETIRSNQIAFVFKPEVLTQSSSDSLFTWPPTTFTVILNCSAVDPTGKVIWRTKISATGKAEFSEFRKDSGMAAKRASEEIFRKLQAEINAAPEFR